VNKSESIVNLSKALLAFQKVCPAIHKNAENPFYKSRYADLPSILEVINKPLQDAGLSIVQGGGGESNGAIAIDTLLVHTSGEWVESRLVLPIKEASPQSAGSAVTYARRYSLSAILSLAADDDDAEAAEKHTGATQEAVSSVTVKDVRPAHAQKDNNPASSKKPIQQDDGTLSCPDCDERGVMSLVNSKTSERGKHYFRCSDKSCKYWAYA
jgi:hypothetical protein